MNVRVVEGPDGRILECASAIDGVDDAIGLVTACIEHGTNRLLIDARWLPDAFFDLRTRSAGEFLQKRPSHG